MYHTSLALESTPGKQVKIVQETREKTKTKQNDLYGLRDGTNENRRNCSGRVQG